MKKLCSSLFILTVFALKPNLTFACSDITLFGSTLLGDKWAVSGRNFDLDQDLSPAMVYRAAGESSTSKGSDGNPGLTWESQYPFVALDYSGSSGKFVDGLNNQGFSASLLWMEESAFPGSATGNQAVALSDLAAWLLGSYDTVAKARSALNTVTVWFDSGNLPYPAHLVLHDAGGNSLVVEWIKGTPVYVDKNNGYNGTLTNGPDYTTQLANLRNFQKLDNDPNQMIGLPGDSTSMSRFVRLATLGKYIAQIVYAPDTLKCFGKLAWYITGADFNVQQAFHLLNRVAILRGESIHTDGTTVKAMQTLTGLVRDHIGKKLYYRFSSDATIREINFRSVASTQKSGVIDSAAAPLPVLREKLCMKPVARYERVNDSLRVNIFYRPADSSGTGLYVFGRMSDGTLLNWTGTDWIQAVDDEIRSCKTSADSPLTTSFVIGKAFFRKYAGMQVFAGAGTSVETMFISGCYEELFKVPTPDEADRILNSGIFKKPADKGYVEP